MSRAAVGFVEVVGIAASGRFVCVASWGWTDGDPTDRSTLTVIDVLDPARPREVGTHRINGRVADVGMSGNTVVWAVTDVSTATRRTTVEVVDITDPTSPTRVGAVTSSGDEAHDLAWAGNIVGVAKSRSTGTAVVELIDVGDPVAPRRVGTLTVSKPSGMEWGIYNHGVALEGGRVGGYRPTSAIWDVALSDSGHHAYLADVEVELHVMDITNPARPRRVGGHQARYSGSGHAIAAAGHHVFVAEVQYSVGNYVGVVEAFDVSDPASPQWVGAYETLGPALDIVISGRYAYVSEVWYEGGNGTSHGVLEVLDIGDPANIQPVGRYDCPDRASRLALTGSRLHLVRGDDDRFSGRYRSALDILDVSNPAKPRRIGGYAGLPSSVFRIAAEGDRIHLTGDVLHILDAAPPAATVPSGSVATPGEAYGVALAGKHAYVADGAAGVQVFSMADPARPQLVGNVLPNAVAWAVTVQGSRGYIAEGEAGLRIVDVANPADPVSLGGYDTPGSAVGVLVDGTIAYVADQAGGVRMIDASNAVDPREIGVHETTGSTAGLARLGSHLLAASREAGLEILEISQPSNPRRVAAFNPGAYVVAVAVAGTHGFIADGVEGFQVLDLADPTRPRRMGVVPGRFLARSVVAAGRFVYVSDANSGLRVFDVANPASPRLLGGSSAVDPYGLAVNGGGILIAARTGGMAMFDAFTLPLGLQAVLGLVPGHVSVRVEGPTGTLAHVQRSSDLRTWQDWQTVTLSEGAQTLHDPTVGPGEQRYYRAVTP